MGIEVPIIILIIATPIYFLCRFIMAKLNIGNQENRKFIAAIPTLILSPMIYVGIIVAFIMVVSYYPKIDFNQALWHSKIEERYKMSQDIINSDMLIELSESEVIELLGEDFSRYDKNHIAYYLGFVPGMFNIDPDVLDIIFEDGKVTKVYQHET